MLTYWYILHVDKRKGDYTVIVRDAKELTYRDLLLRILYTEELIKGMTEEDCKIEWVKITGSDSKERKRD